MEIKDMKERKLLYLFNPISGGLKKTQLIQQVEKHTAAQKLNFEFVETNAQGEYNFLKDKIHHNGITDVIIMGGDGTVNQVLHALHTEDVNFGIIPLGSGNGLAFAANIPKKPLTALEIIFQGNAQYADAFWVNNQFSCMLSGVGFDAQVAHDFATKAGRGLLTYTQQSIINFFKATPYQFEILLDDGSSFFTDAFFISIANSNQFGNNFTIAPSARLNDGLLDVVIVQKMNKMRLPFAVLKQIRGNNKLQQLVEDVSKKNILYFQTPSLTINNIKLAPLHIDGEPRQTEKQLKIKLQKDCFRLIQPA